MTSLLAFNLGVEIGQLLIVVLAVPILNWLFRNAISERMGTIIFSAILAHSESKFADGRIFTGRKAHEMKLVDDLGGLELTISKLGEALGIEGRPKVVYEEPEESLWDWLLSSKVSENLQSNLTVSRARVL